MKFQAKLYTRLFYCVYASQDMGLYKPVASSSFRCPTHSA
jgi:hypothetical protein